jgi:hypothetical protein
MSQLTRRLRSEQGEGIIAGLILLAGVLLPLMFLIPLFARLEEGKLAAAQAARAAVRAAVLAPTADQAQAAAQQALTLEQQESGQPLQMQLTGDLARGEVIQATVQTQVTIAYLPGLGDLGTITLTEQASEPVDSYRSLLPPTGS